MCLSPTLHAVTDYPQPSVPQMVEGTTTDILESDTTPTPEPAPVVHTVYPTVTDEPPEYEDSETIAFPPDSGNRGATEKAASITLSCKPVEYGTPVTIIKTVPVFVVISLDDLIFPIKTNKTREDKQITYGMRWLAPDPGFQNDLTIEGVDVDNDCVRDDIENYIYRKLSGPGNIEKRKYMFEYAKWLGYLLNSIRSESQVKDIYIKLNTVSNCAGLKLGDSFGNKLLNQVFVGLHNTMPRVRRHFDNMAKIGGWSPRSISLGSCQ